MLKNLLIFVAVLCCCNSLIAQDVFSPNDPIITYNSSAAAGSTPNPNQPPYFVMSKWVRTSRVSWNTSNFKSYIWNGMNFRMRFPNNYNAANASKYPVIIFYHGGGEIGSVYDNEDQLVWAAQLFEQRINNNEWNGFMIFPQQPNIGWNDYHFSRVNSILDTLQKYNNSDPDKVITMGLSAGAFGALYHANLYPQRIASALAASPPQAVSLNSNANDWVHVPVWFANGGTDVNPDPFSSQSFYTGFRNAGANIYQSYFVADGHGTWTDMWNMKNPAGAYITDVYWANAHKAQPLVYFQNQQFCSGGPIAARMGISPGFYAYEWQKDGVTLSDATGNEYTATQTGSYTVRFMRTQGGAWSAWTPSPVVVSTKTCSADTLFAEHFSTDNAFGSTTTYSNGNFTCQNGIMTSATGLFTQDATGVQGNRFLVSFTSTGSSCTYNAGDVVWSTATPVTVTPNTNYEYSFYTGSQNATSPAQLAPAINGTALITGYVTVTGTGNTSWKKFTYTWNSGSNTSANLSIINRSVVTTGNDFAIDEISFKLPPAAGVPTCTVNMTPVNNAVLTTNTTATITWTAVTNAVTYDVYLWTGATAPTTPVANVAAVSYSATGLTGSTKYNWYVVPKNNNGIAPTGCSSNQTSFTTAVTPVAPSCVINASPADGATLTTSSTATLTWPAAATATSYDVYLWTGATAPATATASVTATTYNATGLTALSQYNWYVVPKNAVGSSVGCSANATRFNTASGPTVPGCVANTSPANASTLTTNTTATLTWPAAATATSYDVYLWKGATAPTTATANVTTASYNATGLTASSQYSWYVVPKNAVGAAAGCSANATTFSSAAGPSVPGCTTNSSPANASAITTSTTATLTWAAAATATSYDVYLWKGTTAPTTATATVTTTSYSATALTPSTSYKWYIVAKNAVGAATGCSANATSFTTAAGAVTGTGTGLKGQYYNTIGLTGSVYLTRTDATVNFNWGTGSPYTRIDANTFSVRWTGLVQPSYSETYTFYTNSDDGVRLWVNGVQLVNNWTDHSAAENSGTITLVAGVKYNIIMEYYDNTGSSVAQLLWSSASTAKAIIPQKQLYLPGTTNRVADEELSLNVAATDLAVNTTDTKIVATSIFPNPVANGQNTTLLINSDNGGTAAVQIISISGNLMQSEQLNVARGANTKTVHTSNLKPGFYLIQVSGDVSKLSTLKLIVR